MNSNKKADVQLHLEMAQAYLRRGRREDALREFKAAEALAPDYADLKHEIGLVYAIAGKFEKAIEYFMRSLELNPNYLEPRINIAITLSDMGKDEEAMKHFKKAKSIEKNSRFLFGAAGSRIANAHAWIADLYCDVDAYDQAIEEYKKAVDIAPHFFDIKLKLARAYLARENLEKAKEILEEVYEKDEKFKESSRLLGSVYLKMGDRDEAKKIWKRILQENPDDTEASVLLNSLESLDI